MRRGWIWGIRTASSKGIRLLQRSDVEIKAWGKGSVGLAWVVLVGCECPQGTLEGRVSDGRPLMTIHRLHRAKNGYISAKQRLGRGLVVVVQTEKFDASHEDCLYAVVPRGQWQQ